MNKFTRCFQLLSCTRKRKSEYKEELEEERSMAEIVKDPLPNKDVEPQSVQGVHHGKTASLEKILRFVRRHKEDFGEEDSGIKKCTDSTSSLKRDLGHPTPEPELFSPELVENCDGNNITDEYRFFCPHAGQFKCKLTNIVFEMKDKGEVLYRTVYWDTQILNGLHNMEPAGPLYNIECPERSISLLHLPHCEIGKGKDKLCVAHVTGNKTEIIQPLTVTNTHVTVKIESLSLFGLTFPFKGFSNRGQVLLFYKQLTEQTSKLHVHMLPANVAVKNVQKACESYTYNETISNCELFSGQKYRLLCESNDPDCKPNPQILKFHRDYGPKFHPSFEVNFKTSDKVKLTLLNKKGKVVWTSNVLLIYSRRASGNMSLTEAVNFVDKHREQLIQKVVSVMEIADGLKSKNMISAEMYDNIHVQPLSQEKMRLLYKALESGGETVKAEFYKILKEKQPYIVDHLESGPSRD